MESGIEAGDKILLRISNCKEFPIAFLAALTIGAVPIPTSPQLTSPEVLRIIEEIRPRVILRSTDVTSPACAVPEIKVDDLTSHLHLKKAAFHMGDPDRLGYIVYTSGTSGKPLAVMHAHRAIWARQMMWQDWYDLTADDRMLHAGAFNWTFTLGTGLMDPWSVGATSIIPAPDVDPKDLPTLLAASKATIFAAAPGVYRKILQYHSKLNLPKLRHGVCAGEKLSEPLRARWQAVTGKDLHEAFGMTEVSTFISGSPSRPSLPGTLGRPQTGRRVAIIDNDQLMPESHPGSIAVHKSDPGLMLGYLNAPTLTKERFCGDWFLTADLGRMDQYGSITYLGRADDMMNAGGFRVAPLEVEAALSRFDDIHQIGVTEVKVKQDVTVIAAFFTAEHQLDVARLEAFAKANLARYKQPRLYIQLESLPTNSNGKLLRQKLRHIFEAQNERVDQT